MNQITMKELPAEERPYENTWAQESAWNAELLSVIIRTGSRHDSSLSLSKKILESGCGGKACWACFTAPCRS